MQHVPTPSLGHAWDVWEIVEQTGSDDDAASGQGRPLGQVDTEARLDPDDGASHELDAVPRRLRPPAASRAFGGMPSRDRSPCMWAAGALRGSRASTTATRRREWLYVLSGHLRLVLADHDLVLGPGEAGEFDTRPPHWFGSTGVQPVEILSPLAREGEQMHVRAKPRQHEADDH